MQVNTDFFIIKISKKLQAEKRKKLTISTMGYLGIKHSQSENKKGFLVVDVEKGSPAFEAGFKHKDILTAINGKTIKTYNDMIDSVTKCKPGEAIRITYINSFAVDQTTSEKTVILGERPLVLDIPDSMQDMRFNLQFGEIVCIGDNAAKNFPEAEMGDNLIVHHAVEYKEKATGDKNWNDWHLIEANEHFEYRMAHSQKEVMGVWKIKETDMAKAIVPYHTYVFCHHAFKKSEFQFKNGIWVPDGWVKSSDDLNAELEELKAQIIELNTSSVMQERQSEKNADKQREIKTAIDNINLQRRDITKQLHRKHLVECRIIFINKNTNEFYKSDLVPGDTVMTDYYTLYPLDIFGTHYSLVRADQIDAYSKK